MAPKLSLATQTAVAALGMTCIGLDLVRAAIADDDPNDELGFLRQLDGILSDIDNLQKRVIVLGVGEQPKTIDVESPKQLE